MNDIKTGDIERRYDPRVERLALLDFGNVSHVDVLDIGAGHGELSIAAASTRACHVTCVDPDPEKLARAREAASRAGLLGQIDFEIDDATHLHFPDSSFTCIACYSVLHHVKANDREKVVAEAARVAKNKVLFSELTPVGARLFDDVLHRGEKHMENRIDKAWILSQLEGLGKLETVDRLYTYFVVLVK